MRGHRTRRAHAPARRGPRASHMVTHATRGPPGDPAKGPLSTSAIQDQAMGVHPVAQSHVPRTRSRCSQPHASVDSISAGRSRHPPTARADARARGGAHRSRPTRSVARPSRPGPADAAPGLAAAVGHGRATPTHAPTINHPKFTIFSNQSHPHPPTPPHTPKKSSPPPKTPNFFQPHHARRRSPDRWSTHAPATTGCKWPRARSVVRTP